jgi:Bacterial toxin 37
MSSPGAERGQATAEYAGALLLVGLILAVLFTVVPSVGGTFAHAVCLISGGDDCGAAGSSTTGAGAADASASGTSDVSEPAATPQPFATPAPAPTPNVVSSWTGQAANLPQGGSRPYVPPKKSRGQPHRVRGDRGYGYEDEHGNVWVWDPRGHAGPHWDVQHPDGSHTNVYPDGEVHQGKDNFPNKSPDNEGGGSADDNTAKAVGIAGTIAAAGTILWWVGKAASPLCGPAAPVCAVVL